MSPARWRSIGLWTITWLVPVLSASAMGTDLEAGIHGMAWTSPAAEHAHLTRVRSAGRIGYFVNRNMIYRVANQPVPGVVYGFYEGQLFAVYIKLQSPNQAFYLEKHFSAEYGPAKVTTTNAGRQTTYRWRHKNLKIKLKIRESVDEIKLGLYYKPLASRANEDQMEAISPEAFPNAPAEDASTGSAPLF